MLFIWGLGLGSKVLEYMKKSFEIYIFFGLIILRIYFVRVGRVVIYSKLDFYFVLRMVLSFIFILF